MKVKSLVKKMGLLDKTGFIDNIDDISKLNIPGWIKRALRIIKPDVFYFDNYQEINNPVFILFFENIKEDRERNIHKQIWNFNMAPIVIIIKDKDIELYNGLKYESNKQFLSKLSLEIDDFSYLKLRTGKAWEVYRDFYDSKTRVDYYLLNNIEIALISLEKLGLNRLYANSIIGRLIFSRYLIDREIEIDYPFVSDNVNEDRKKALLNIVLDKEKLYSHFNFLRGKFNGDLFPVHKDEKENLTQKHLDIIYHLFKGVDLKNGQLNMFEVYDFSIMPIELISNIYERFIGEEKQKSNKAFYTPLFLVDYIISNTIKGEISKKRKIKVLDPSCGSGIFLVETYRKIIENNLSENKKISGEKLKDLLVNCVYGIDIDENAINIAIFSLYLTLLDYINTEEISSFKFPVLKNKNFYAEDFFETDALYNNQLKDIEFDYIIGNPPWGSKKGNHLGYSKEKKIPISDNQIAQTFLVRASDFGDENTRYSFIVTSKILYNLRADKFRAYFLNNYCLHEVFDLSIVRKIIFDKATGPAAIITYKKANGNDTRESVVKHISIKPSIDFKMFKTVIIEKNDLKLVQQKYFMDYDWIWKVLLYGNTLDFEFIKRLKELTTLQETIKENDLNFGVGFTLRSNHNKVYKPEYSNGNYLYVKTEQLSRIILDESVCSINDIEYFYRPSNESLFKAPHLIIKKGIDKSPVITYSSKNAVFKNIVYGLSGVKEQENIIKNIGAYLLSDIACYFLFMQTSQWGIERDEIYKGEYLILPMRKEINTSKLWKYYNQAIERLKEDEGKALKGYENKTQFFYDKVNKEISNIFNLKDYERSLIAYVQQVSIPLFRNEQKPLKELSTVEAKEYTKVILKHFSSRFDNLNKKINGEIYMDQYFVCIYFTISDNKNSKDREIRINKDYTIENLLNKIAVLSYEKLSSDLFIRKDIKGFEKDGFYVIKPNEYKNWHKAVAYMDINEFMDAILKSGMKKVELDHD